MTYIDPEVQQVADELSSTLSTMGSLIEGLRGRVVLPCATFRMPPAMESAVARWMADHHITNQSEALRRLVEKGLQS